MNPDDDNRPLDEHQSDRLDSYLDDLVRGIPTPPPGLDPSVAEAASRMQSLADTITDASISAADEQRTWEALMGYPSTATVVPFPSLPAAPAQDEPRQKRTNPRRLARVASRPLGLVATLTLVVLVGLSAFAVYQVAPGGNDPEPTSQAAFGDDDIPILEATETDEADPVWGTLDDGTAYVRIPWNTCDVTPATYEEIMEVVTGGPNYPFDHLPPNPQIATVEPGPNSTRQYSFYNLPAGEPVSEDVIAAIVDNFGTYLGCQDAPLRQGQFLTDEGLAREYWEAPSRYLQDGGPDGFRLSMLWHDHMGRQGEDPEYAGRLSPFYLYDFRMLDTGQVVAFMSIGRGDELPEFYVEAGYVVFRQVDGQWLIDEQFRR